MLPNATGIFQTNVKFRTATDEEKNSNKTNNSIIGVIEGEHFCPAGFSRNGRYYPEDEEFGKLWTKQLENSDLKERISNKVVFGTLGHSLNIGEKELREGLVSHFTTDHEIRETGNPEKPYEGFARSYILNTPAGRCLKTYFEAGCNLYTSTRADGTYIEGKMKKTPEGKEVPVLDPDTFKYERNDFIINPGFLEANPKLREGLDERVLVSINEAVEGADFTKDNEISDKDTKLPSTPPNIPDQSKSDTSDGKKDKSLKGKEMSTDDDAKNKKEDNNESVSENIIEDLLTEIENLKNQIKEQENKSNENVSEEVSEKLEALKKYEEFGDFETVSSAINEANKLFVEIGTTDEIKDKLEKIGEFFSEVGDPETIKEELSISSELKEKITKFEKLGITEGFVSEFGSIDKIKETINSFNEFTEKYGALEDAEKVLIESKKVAIENKAHKISERTGIDYEKILNHLNQGMDEKEIVDIYSKMNSFASDRYIFAEKEEIKEEKKASYIVDENESRLSWFFRNK